MPNTGGRSRTNQLEITSLDLTRRWKESSEILKRKREKRWSAMNLQCDSWSDIWSLSYSSQLLCSNSFSADWELIHLLPWSSTETPLWASNRQGRKEKGAAVDSKIEKKPKGRDTSRDGEDCVKGGAFKKMRHCTAPSLLLPPSIFKRELEAKNLINSFAAEAGKSSGTKARTHKKIFIC